MRTPDDLTPTVVGAGAVSALGFGLGPTWDALLAGRAGGEPVGDAPLGSGLALAARIAPPYLRGEVPRGQEAQVKFLNGSSLLAVEAVREAWGSAGWADADVPPAAKGLWLAQVDAGDWSCHEMRPAFDEATDGFVKPLEDAVLNRAASRRVKPFFLLESLKNNAFSFLSAWYELGGANTSVAGFAPGTAHLLDLAARSVARGDQDHALVVGAGRVADAVARRDALYAGLARPAADETYRPFDRAGRGVVLGEGAAALAVERWGSARARARRPLALLLGYGGASGEPLAGAPAPAADTLVRAARAALAEAEVRRGDLLGVVLPALGLPAADQAMLDAVGALPEARSVPIVSWRGALGHCALAGEAIDLALAGKALAEGRLPGTVGLLTPLESAQGRVREDATSGREPAILVLSAGLQGGAAAWVVARPD